MSKTKTWLLATAIAFLIGLALLHLRTQPKYVVGMIGNFKGINSQSSYESLNTVNLAYDLFKQKHPGCFNIELLPVDDSYKPELVPAAYASIIEKADILIVHTTSTGLLRIKDAIHKHPEKLHILIGPTTAEVTGLDDNMLRCYPDTEEEQRQIARFAERQGYRKLLIIYDEENNKYTMPAVEFFRKHAGGLLVDVAGFRYSQMNIQPALQKLEAGNYDAVYILVGGMPREAGIVAQNARRVKPGIAIINSPWVRGRALEECIGTIDEGILLASHLKTHDNPANDKFQEEYKKRFGDETKEHFSSLCFDMANIAFEAMLEAGSAKTDRLLPVILNHEYGGVTGKIKFNACGDSASSLYFYRMEKGRMLPVE